MNTKNFHISDILSITTGRLVSNDGMDGVYNILNYMENTSLSTIGLTIVKDKCTEVLDSLYPQLSKNNLKTELYALDEDLKKSNNTEETVNTWVKALENKHGSYFSVPQRLSNDDGFEKKTIKFK